MIRFSRIADEHRKKKRKLLVFISTGDTCRAPMAAGYFRKLLHERGKTGIEVRDAGIMTVSGLKAAPEAIQVLDTVDVDLRRHSSRKMSNESIKRADLIVGMSSFHVQTALRQSDMAKGKTFLLKEYVGWEHKNVQISDPMGGTLEVFKKCFQEIKESCDRLIEHEFVASDEEEQAVEAQEAEAAQAGEEEEKAGPVEARRKAEAPAGEKAAVVKKAAKKSEAPKKNLAPAPAKGASSKTAPAKPKAAAAKNAKAKKGGK